MAMLMLSMLASALFYDTAGDRIGKGLFTLGVLIFDPLDVRFSNFVKQFEKQPEK